MEEILTLPNAKIRPNLSFWCLPFDCTLIVEVLLVLGFYSTLFYARNEDIDFLKKDCLEISFIGISSTYFSSNGYVSLKLGSSSTSSPLYAWLLLISVLVWEDGKLTFIVPKPYNMFG
jgi:hypothetical protein